MERLREVESGKDARPVFAFATGHYDNRDAEADAHRPLGTDDYLLTYTRNGAGRIGHADGDFLTEPGSLTLILPRVPHDYGVIGASPRWERIWVHFQPRTEWADLLQLPELRRGIRYLYFHDAELKSRIEARMLDVHRLATLDVSQGRRLAMNALEEALLWSDFENPTGSSARLDTRVRKAVDLISSDLRQTLSMARLAKHCGLSRSRLSDLFRKQTGTTPQRFQEHERMIAASRLLVTTSRSVSEIAVDVGFASPFYFSLRFKRAIGVSPRAYRERSSTSVGKVKSE